MKYKGISKKKRKAPTPRLRPLSTSNTIFSDLQIVPLFTDENNNNDETNVNNISTTSTISSTELNSINNTSTKTITDIEQELFEAKAKIKKLELENKNLRARLHFTESTKKIINREKIQIIKKCNNLEPLIFSLFFTVEIPIKI